MVKKIIKLINLRDKGSRGGAELDMHGFIEFMLQVGHFIND